MCKGQLINTQLMNLNVARLNQKILSYCIVVMEEMLYGFLAQHDDEQECDVNNLNPSDGASSSSGVLILDCFHSTISYQ